MHRIPILALAVFLIGAYTASAQSVAGPGSPTQPRIGAFVDADGDGICDLLQTRARVSRPAGRGGNGPGDGTGQRVGPRNGTGYGATTALTSGAGICDGTGPKGRIARKR